VSADREGEHEREASERRVNASQTTLLDRAAFSSPPDRVARPHPSEAEGIHVAGEFENTP
jgi:hypothetical protein